MHIQDYFEQNRSYALRQRNRAVLWLRFSNGVAECFAHPWKLAPLLVLLALCLLTWHYRGKVVLTSSNLLLCTIWGYVVAILVALLSALSIFGLITVLGTPYQAKRVEAALAHIAVIDRYGFPPVLVSRHHDPEARQVFTLTFYSRGIARELWESKRRDTEDVLNVHWIEDARYGGRRKDNGNYIVLTVASGTGTAGRGETLYDDEL